MSNNHVTGVNTETTAQADQKMPEAVSPPTPQAAPKPVEAPAPKPQTPAVGKPSPLGKHAGLDIGTMNIICSRQQGNAVDTKRIRDVFIDLTEDQVNMLKLSGGTSFVKKDGNCYVLGDDAANIANIFGRELRTPLKRGVISAGEIEAMEMLKVMVG
jgi:hypothetical protein